MFCFEDSPRFLNMFLYNSSGSLPRRHHATHQPLKTKKIRFDAAKYMLMVKFAFSQLNNNSALTSLICIEN